MPLIRVQKEDLVSKLISELNDSRVALVFSYTALNMKSNDDLRTKAFEKNAKIRMISNSLLKLILKKIGREMEVPSSQLALAYGFNDEVEAAKTLVDFGKQTNSLTVLGGWIDGNFFDAAQVTTLASLPGKEALQAQLVGRLGGLISSLAYSINFPLQKLAYVVEAIKTAQPTVAETKEETVTDNTPAETSEESTNIKTEETPTESSEEASVPVEEK